MAYGEKYTLPFKGLENIQYEVEIWEDGYTGSTTEIRGMANPFSVFYPKFTIFEPVRGAGCDINLFSETDREFFDLYTPDMLKYKIIFKKSGFIHWCGFLDSELYSEPFNFIDRYPVSFTGNDGLSLLDRIYYLDDNGDHFTGATTQWQVIANCLNKISLILDWWGVCVNISTSSPEVTIGAGETLFHKVYVLNDNFYDEDNQPFTCRKVLEEVLRVYGAFLIISDNKVIISDHNIILDAIGNTPFNAYYPTADLPYAGATSIKKNIGDVSTLGFASEDQTLNVISGVNKQTVAYSPYRWIELINFDNAQEDFYNLNTGFTETFGQPLYQWEQTYFNNSYSWEKFNNGTFATYIGLDGENEGETDYYLKIVPYSYTGTTVSDSIKSFTYIKKLPLLVPTENYRIKFEMQVFARTIADLNGELPDETPIRKVELYTKLVIGDVKYEYAGGTPDIDGASNGWVELTHNFDFRFRIQNRIGGDPNGTPDNQGYLDIRDTWTDLKFDKVIAMTADPDDDVVQRKDFTIPLTVTPILNGGYMAFTIYHFRAYDPLLNDITDDVNDLRIKNLRITIVDSKGNDVNTEDVEYDGILNPLYKNEGEKITTFLGTNYDDFPTERGGLFRYVVVGGIMPSYWDNIKEWTRWGFTGTTEELLLRSVVSNYENPSLEITATINRINQTVGYLTYSNYLTPKFMITSCTHNYAAETTELTMQQITADNLSVYLNY